MVSNHTPLSQDTVSSIPVLRDKLTQVAASIQGMEAVNPQSVLELVTQFRSLVDYVDVLEQNVFDLNVILSTTLEHSNLLESGFWAQRDADARKQQQYEAILQHTQEGVVLLDTHGKCLAANCWLTTALGRSTEDVVGHTLVDLFGESQYVGCLRPAIEGCLAGQTLVSHGALMVYSDNTGVRYWEWSFDPFVSTQEGITHLIGVCRDVTGYRRALAQLHQHTLYLDKVRDAIVVIGLDRTIYYVNHSAEVLYGWPREQIRSNDRIDRLIQSPEKLAMIFVALESQGTWRGEMLHVGKDRQRIWVDSQWDQIESTDGTSYILISNHDISEKKRLEQQFLQIQRMEGIGAVASGIAHDLNNVLSALFMSVRLLKGTCKDDKSIQVLDLLDNSAKRGVNLVRQILEFTRGIDRDEVSVHVKGILKEIHVFAKTTFPKSIAVVLVPVPQDAWVILGNPTQIHQVILNIGVNAKDAMPDGGTITMSTHNVMVSRDTHPTLPDYCQAGPFLKIVVSDTGKGMSAATMARIFDPFFTTKATGKGTGLGLSTVHTIVKNHRGFIEVQSGINEGTTFSMYFPAKTGDDRLKMGPKKEGPR